jgi:amino acid transporter
MSSSVIDKIQRPAVPVFVATTVMLSFISFWRAAAIVLSDLASSAYYVGGDTENVIGKSAPWFVLAVMLFSYAVRAVYIESSSMFVRGGVYRVVKEAMGGTLAKLSVSALLFDYVLTGPISAVSAGQYMAGFVQDLSVRFGHPVAVPMNAFAAVFGVGVTAYFWWKNIQGIHESSEKAMWIMRITTVMVVILIGWCLFTLSRTTGVHLPPAPLPRNMTLDKNTLGWLSGSWITHLTFVILIVGFGHSVLAMSGEESLAQVNREIEAPKLKNLERAGVIIFLYSLLFTSLVSFFAVMIIPDAVRPSYFANLISGLAMYMTGPTLLKLIFQGFVVLVGVLILSGAVNTAIVGANGVLNRISEDGVMTPWFLRPHRKFGTSFRLINLIVGLQVLTIVLSRGNVYLLAALYAFGVIWSFAFKALAVLVLRFTHKEQREWKVPGNVTIGGVEVPLGLGAIALVLFLVAIANLFTKPDATIAGVAFSAAFFAVFTISERLTHRKRTGADDNVEQFRVYSNPALTTHCLDVRPGNLLVAVRDPHNLAYLREVLRRTDTSKQDVVVMTARLYHREHAFSGSTVYEAKDIFDQYEQELFTAVVSVAEKEGKAVSLLVVPGSNVFDTILMAAQQLQSAKVVTGFSEKLSPDEQGKLTGDAWERLPDPKPHLDLELVDRNGRTLEYHLGPHTPELRREDVGLLHDLWLDATQDTICRQLHHYHVVSLALKRLKDDMQTEKRAAILRELEREIEAPSPVHKH